MQTKPVFWTDTICPKCGGSWVLLNIRQVVGLNRIRYDTLYFCLDCKHKWGS